MSQFQKNLQALPSIDYIERLVLRESDDPKTEVLIENKAGKSGSLAVYNFLKQEYGELNPTSAKVGIEMFAEHVASARETPGAHPNIDLLFDVIGNNRTLSIQVIEKAIS
jgi:hypothetical protein